MFFIISKIFWSIAEPVSFLILAGFTGLIARALGAKRLGGWLTAISLICLAIIVFTPVSALIMLPLEDRFPRPPANEPSPDGIIVLGGGLDPDLTVTRGLIEMSSAAGIRLVAGVELAKRYPEAKLIFTGGVGVPGEPDLSEAKPAHELWTALGVPEAQMEFESKSRNTWENAVFTRDIVHPKPGEKFFLVTSAWHMPRSMGIFRQIGFDVTAFPVDYRTYGTARDYLLSQAAYERVTMFDLAAKEWIGLIAYHLSGKTDAWFPGP